jgi:hypothetical protein
LDSQFNGQARIKQWNVIAFVNSPNLLLKANSLKSATKIKQPIGMSWPPPRRSCILFIVNSKRRGPRLRLGSHSTSQNLATWNGFWALPFECASQDRWPSFFLAAWNLLTECKSFESLGEFDAGTLPPESRWCYRCCPDRE